MGVLKVVLEELLGYIRGYSHVLEAAAILVVALLIAILASRYFRSKALARLSVEIVNPPIAVHIHIHTLHRPSSWP
jgi:hypothetical protein